MTIDDEFEPKLGKPRARPSAKARRFVSTIRKGISTSSGPKRKSGFDGSRIGRGAGVGRVLHARDGFAAFRSRRVVVQTRVVKIMGHGTNRVRLHLRYLQRDGMTREGLPGKLYDARGDAADEKSFVDRAEGDRHQFRFIVSPEDGAEYEDLKPFIRKLMERMESDLGTKLDWVAVDHYNTGHPHSHIVVRGKDDRGSDLVIAREYIAHGMRERAAEIASLDLGPRTDLEIQNRLRREVEQERFTSLDGDLLKQADAERLVTPTGDAFRQSLRAGRLRKLEALGLAEEVSPSRFRLVEDLRPVLQRMGERGDIIKAMHRSLTEGEAARDVSAYAIYDPLEQARQPLVGRVAAIGMANAFHDQPYLIVDGADGKSHFVRIDPDASAPAKGAIVSVESKVVAMRPADRTIAEIAKANDGRYSAELHLQHDPKAGQAFVDAHVRRLEALRRTDNAIRRDTDGSWQLPQDYLRRAEDHERDRLRNNAVQIQTLSSIPIEGQTHADGATWLDRSLVSSANEYSAGSQFGRDVRAALAQRQQWLIAEGLASLRDGVFVARPDMLETLRRRELARVAGQLSKELGLSYSEARQGQRLEGIYKRSVDLASGKFALIEKSREFTLVPWRDVLERHIGQSVSGVMRGDVISWTIGRQRSGPSIS